MNTLKPAELLAEVEDVLRTVPSVDDFSVPGDAELAWMGRAAAAVNAWNPATAILQFSSALDQLRVGLHVNYARSTAIQILYEAAHQREKLGMYARRRIRIEEYNRLLFEWLHPRVASYCQERGRPYPSLDCEGEIQESITGNRREGLK